MIEQKLLGYTLLMETIVFIFRQKHPCLFYEYILSLFIHCLFKNFLFILVVYPYVQHEFCSRKLSNKKGCKDNVIYKININVMNI